MNRVGDWEKALVQYLASKEREPFEFGTNDCGLFAAGAVLAMTGEDPAAEFRGNYNSQATAVRAAREAGYADLAAVMDAKFPEREIAYARRGDIAILPEEHEVGSLGVVIGDFAMFMLAQEGEPGFVRMPRLLWAKVWAVG